MALTPETIAAWSVALPGTLGLAAGIACRVIGADAASRIPRMVRGVLPVAAALLGYAVAEVFVRGWPSESPIRLAWPILSELSSSQWGIWIAVVATLAAGVEAFVLRKTVVRQTARWLGRAVAVAFLGLALLASVVERGEFDSALEASLWLGGTAGLALSAMGLTDLALSRCGARTGGAALLLAGTVFSLLLFMGGLAPQAQVLGGLFAAFGGLTVAGGATAGTLSGAPVTLFFTLLTAGAVTGHFHAYPEFDAWVWAAAMLLSPMTLSGALVARLPRPVFTFLAKLAIPAAAAAGLVGFLIATLGVPEIPGINDGTGSSGSESEPDYSDWPG
ncbi:MAG: hypothetical protein AAF108_05495 [Planctomycetota bacterium]